MICCVFCWSLKGSGHTTGEVSVLHTVLPILTSMLLSLLACRVGKTYRCFRLDPWTEKIADNTMAFLLLIQKISKRCKAHLNLSCCLEGSPILLSLYVGTENIKCRKAVVVTMQDSFDFPLCSWKGLIYMEHWLNPRESPNSHSVTLDKRV